MILDGSERVTSDANNIYVASKSSSATTAGSSSTPSSNNNNNPLLNEIEFGNFTTNSYVYVGGLPSWYSTKLSMLALPSVVFEPRFRGSIRNILYADDDTAKPRRQEVMAYKVSLRFHLSTQKYYLMELEGREFKSRPILYKMKMMSKPCQDQFLNPILVHSIIEKKIDEPNGTH